MADYSQLKEYFRFKIGRNFKKGIIDDEEIDLYFGFGFREEGMPVMQLHIDNKKNVDGTTTIKLHLANYWIVVLAIIPLIMLVVMLFTGFPVSGAVSFVCIGYVMYYASGLFLFERQFNQFLNLFRKWEAKI